jgi:putative salt-induced outer membrane protein YdiY
VRQHLLTQSHIVSAMLVAALVVVAASAGNAQNPRPPISCTLNNGDRLSGDVVSITSARVRIQQQALGRVTLRRAQIAVCESSDSTTRKKLGALALGQLGEIPITTVTKVEERRRHPPAPEVRVVSLERLAHPSHPVPLAARALPTYVSHVGWKRSLGSTYMLTRGNANVSNLGFTGSVARRADRSQIALSAKREFGSQEGSATENYLSATLRYDLALGPNDSAAALRPSFFTEAVYEHDPFAQIARRAVENTGFSVPLTRNPHDNIALEIGTGVTNEAPTGGAAYTRIGGLLRLAARQIFGAAKSDQALAVFPDLTGPPGHYRVNTDLNLAAPIAKSISLKLGVTNRYDTKPQADVKKSDTTIQSGVALEF